MIWTPIAMVLMAASSLATGLTMVTLRRNWDLHVSSVRWLFVLFFLYLWLWCSSRAVYLAYIWLLPHSDIVDDDTSNPYSYGELDQLGTHAVLHLKQARSGWAAAVMCFGDIALFGVALWMFPLTYELSKIATKSMDRGVAKEKQQIQLYCWTVHALIFVFGVVECALAIRFGGYTIYTLWCLFVTYFVQFVSLGYMVGLLCMLRIKGRQYETVHGVFVASPVYQRLKRIMIVYSACSFQYQLSSVILYATNSQNSVLMDCVSVSQLIYHTTGLALAITTSCSQSCVIHMCSMCLPEDVEAQFHARQFHGGHEHPASTPRDTFGVTIEYNEPPRVNPVFVFTDIESSSALWAFGDGRIMQRATEIHDNILRSSLTKHRGYEITTCGDAFQLAFHTIREAVEYCLDVQLQLLVAHWPKELHGMVPATRKQRSGHRLIFGGLRVRMGIHDTVDSDGPLVHSIHAVTGKMTYTGASEVIANEIGDLGDGGQILVTKRVAEWLQMYEDLISIECVVESVSEYAIPQLKAKLEIFQVVPLILLGRKKFFSNTLRPRLSSVSFVGSAPSTISSNSRQRLSSYDYPSQQSMTMSVNGRQRFASYDLPVQHHPNNRLRLASYDIGQQNRENHRLMRNASQASILRPDPSAFYRATSM